MSTVTAPLEIRVVYPLTSRQRAAIKAGRPAPVVSRSVAQPWRLGLLSLIMAGVYCYVMCWPVYSFVYVQLAMKAPIPAQYLAPPPGKQSELAGSILEGLSSQPAGAADPNRTFQQMLVQASGWGVLTTLAIIALVVSAGAVLGQRFESGARRKFAILTIGGVLALLWGGYDLFTRSNWEAMLPSLRGGMIGVGVVSLLAGLAVARHGKFLSRLASIMLIVSAIGSAVVVYLWGQAGAIDPAYRGLFYVGLAFVIHSAYGWLLWPMSARWAQ